MQSLMKLIKRVTGVEVEAEGNEAGALYVANESAFYEELNRQGNLFSVETTTPTAAVVALPTTTAGLGLYNPAADGGKSMIIDALYAINIVAHTTLGQHCLIAVQGQTRVAALAGGLVVRKLNGNGAATSAPSIGTGTAGGAILDAVTGVAIGWRAVGESKNTSVISLPGVSLYAPVNGKMIVPPGRQLGINVLSSNVEFTWVIGAIWHEKQITLG